MRKLVLTGLMLIGLLVAAGPASATDYCVAPNTGCGLNNVGDLQTALDWAGLSDNADRIFLGAGTYIAGTGGFAYDVPTAPVEIIGAGQAATTLTGPANGDQFVLKLHGGPGTSVHHLKVEMPENVASGAKGIQTNAVVAHVTVSEAPVQATYHIGIALDGGALDHSVVMLTGVQENIGVWFVSGKNTVTDSGVSGIVGIVAAADGTIERANVDANEYGIQAKGADVSVANSVVQMNDASGIGIYAIPAGPRAATLAVDGVDVVDKGQGGIKGIQADNSGSPDANVAVSVDNSLIRGAARSFGVISGAGAGNVTMGVNYSDYDPEGDYRSGPHAALNEDHRSNVGDAGVFGIEGWDEPLQTSPLVDAGDPAEPQGLDFRGHPLVTDGNGDGIARRDIGAIETPAVPVSQSSGGGSTQLSGAASTTGTSPTPASAAADKQAPVLTALSLSHKTFAVGRAKTAIAAVVRGTRMRYTLSEAATVVVRLVHGRKTAGKLTRRAAKGANAIAFSGRIGRRALKPGRYTAVVTATDAAGNKSLPKRIGFRIIGR